MNSPRQGIRNIPEICVQHGISKVIITPGSRNAPLIISFNQHDKITCLSITDERSAGYFALGIAQVTNRPVALVCTSGTAALNFGPAIAEAWYQKLPLIVFTADRPPEWIDQADGQTIRQTGLFSNHVKQNFILPVETSNEEDLWYHDRLISQAVDLACRLPQGPVHINVPLREPLYTELPQMTVKPKIFKTFISETDIQETKIESLLNIWSQSAKKMIIAGFGKPDFQLEKLLGEIAIDKSVVVIAENLSNMVNSRFIYAPERFFATLKPDELADYQPDLLLTLANSVVSKKLKQYLRTRKPSQHWHLGPDAAYTDTFQSLTLNVNIPAELFFQKVTSKNLQNDFNSNYNDLFHRREEKICAKQLSFLKQAPFSDLKSFEIILQSLPEGTNLHLANSTPVRYAQLFESRSDIDYYSNRGTSGIDGCISTAAGACYGSKQPTTVIAGDLAFIYDSNGLWNNYLDENFRIIVLNNGGGNIFSLIETGREMESFREYFETPHHVNLKRIADAFGIKHYHCSDSSGLRQQLKLCYAESGPAVLEVRTDGRTNTKVFREYFGNIGK